jgi:hypothetical protein
MKINIRNYFEIRNCFSNLNYSFIASFQSVWNRDTLELAFWPIVVEYIK